LIAQVLISVPPKQQDYGWERQLASIESDDLLYQTTKVSNCNNNEMSIK
jgi:hypothetical protein